MKSSIFFILNILTFSIAIGQGIQFEPDGASWTATLNKAEQANKIIFVVAYSNSCHNCQDMFEKVYPQTTVGVAFNSSYINIKMDAENGEGLKVAEQYGVRAYPSYLFINGKGNLLHKTMGSMTVEKFIEMGVNALKPEHQFYTLKNRFDNGDRSPSLLKTLTFMAKDLSEYDLLDTVHLAYLATQKDWLTKDNMELLLTAMKSIEQTTFAFLLQNQAAFIKEYGDARINNQLDEVVLNSLSFAAYDPQKRDFDLSKARKYAAPYLPVALLDKSMSLFSVNQFMRKQETDLFLSAAVKHFEQYPCYNGSVLNNIALSFYEKTNDPVLLEKALNWALNAIKLKDNHIFNDTAAALYFKLGNKEKAKEYAQKAIQKATESGSNAYETIALLKKIEGQ